MSAKQGRREASATPLQSRGSRCDRDDRRRAEPAAEERHAAGECCIAGRDQQAVRRPSRVMPLVPSRSEVSIASRSRNAWPNSGRAFAPGDRRRCDVATSLGAPMELTCSAPDRSESALGVRIRAPAFRSTVPAIGEEQNELRRASCALLSRRAAHVVGCARAASGAEPAVR